MARRRIGTRAGSSAPAKGATAVVAKDRAATGIAGLDDILGGGLPRDYLYLVQGDPGTGKTTLGLQFLLAGVAQGEKVVYVTLSETREEILGVARSHGWSLEGIELQEISAAQQQLQAQAQQTVFEPAEVELSETTKTLLEVVNRTEPSRVVLDSLSELRLLAGGALRFRQQMLAVRQYFAQRHCTVLLLDERTVQAEDRQMESLAHGVLIMELRAPEFGADRRQLRVMKIRGMTYRQGYHDYVIRTGGLVVYPHLVAAEHRGEGTLEAVSSGNVELDNLTGGGLARGTCTLAVGPTGVGKSTIALQYAIAAAQRQERTAIYLFDERPSLFLARGESMGMRPAQYVDRGLITFQQIDPAEMSPGEFAQRVRDAVEASHTRMLIIDSLDGYLTAMPAERLLVLQLHELLMYLGQHAVTTFLAMEQRGMLPSASASTGVDISFVADAVLLLRYYEYQGQIRRAISCLKKRTGAHESAIRDLQFTSNGLVIGKPLMEFRGILTGVPVREAEGQVRDDDVA